MIKDFIITLQKENIILMSNRVKGFLLIILGTTFWGATGVVMQYLLHEKMFNTAWLTCVRLICAGIILLAVDKLIYHGKTLSIWQGKSVRDIIIFSMFGMLGTQFTFISTILYSNAATATILQYLMPIVILIYILITEKRKPMFRELLCILMAITGTFLLATKGSLHTLAISREALFLGLISAFASALYTLQPRNMLKTYRSSLVVGWGMFFGGFLLAFFQSPFDFSGIFDLKAAVALLFVIVCGTVISFWAYIESTKYLYPTEVGSLASIEPFSSVLLSVLFMHVVFGLPEIIGSILIVSTIFILTRR